MIKITTTLTLVLTPLLCFSQLDKYKLLFSTETIIKNWDCRNNYKSEKESAKNDIYIDENDNVFWVGRIDDDSKIDTSMMFPMKRDDFVLTYLRKNENSDHFEYFYILNERRNTFTIIETYGRCIDTWIFK